MKIATFNVNGIGARLPALLRWLAESKPDVACLQELKAPQEKFPEAAIREAGYGVIWHGQKSWNGVAILARGADPVESRESGRTADQVTEPKRTNNVAETSEAAPRSMFFSALAAARPLSTSSSISVRSITPAPAPK